MKRHGLSPDDLVENPEFELIEEVTYSDLKAFIIKEIGHKSRLIRVYSVVQVISIIILTGIILFYLFGWIYNDKFQMELKTIIISIILSFTLLIIVHELIHALAFVCLGKKDIGIGAQWKKFLFYAESNREVLDRREIQIVALAPFIVVSIVGLGLYLIAPWPEIRLAGLVFFLIHFFFCGGDFAIISFFNRHKTSEIYTFDDRGKKRSYYYRKVN